MPGKGAVTRINPARLPSLSHLRIRNPDKQAANPCLGIMTNMLSCWASSGASMSGCAAIEQQLRSCMDEQRPKKTGKSPINYHLQRLYPKIAGPRKKDGVGRGA